MSRIAKSPVVIPEGVNVTLDGDQITVKGKKETLNTRINPLVEITESEGTLTFSPRKDNTAGWSMTGTFRSLVNGMVVGVTEGYERKLELVGVGYRAQAKGKSINLTLGFSHPVEYQLPEGVEAETPSQTEIVLKSANKQLVGQVAAEIRRFRPPEPYKGKGVRYAGEQVRRKEAKKK